MVYDIIIIGAAPAGLSAALYGARQGNSVLVIDKNEPGGQAIKTNLIENYPAFDPKRPSRELIEIMVDQAKRFGAEIILDEVLSVDLKAETKKIETRESSYEGRSVIIATGAYPRELNVPGEDEFTGKGVGYCATCDAPFFQDLEVYVVGGGNSAIDEALYLTKFARKVNILVWDENITADQITTERAKANEKIEIHFNKSIVEFKGQGLLNEIIVQNNLTGEKKSVGPTEGDMTFGVFIFIGNIPNSDLFKDELKLDKYGYIPTDEYMKTELDKVYAAGDVRDTNLRQVITAAADGARAAHFLGKELEG